MGRLLICMLSLQEVNRSACPNVTDLTSGDRHEKTHRPHSHDLKRVGHGPAWWPSPRSPKPAFQSPLQRPFKCPFTGPLGPWLWQWLGLGSASCHWGLVGLRSSQTTRVCATPNRHCSTRTGVHNAIQPHLHRLDRSAQFRRHHHTYTYLQSIRPRP